MPQQCLAIYDTQTGLWLIGWNPQTQEGTFGNSKNAICFPDEESRDSVLAYLNQNEAGRFVGQNPPPR